MHPHVQSLSYKNESAPQARPSLPVTDFVARFSAISMKLRNRLRNLGLVLLIACGAETPVWAAGLTVGDIIVSVNASGNPTVREYSTGGALVQTVSAVPLPPGGTSSDVKARDLLHSVDGAIFLFNGTFEPAAARFDLGTSTWTQTSIPGWSTVNATDGGGIDRVGQFLFLSDMETFGPGDQPKGVIRLDLTTGNSARFATAIAPNDFDIGQNGILYAIDGTGSPQNTIYKFDPFSGAALGTVSVPNLDYRGIAVAQDGSFFLTTLSGIVAHHSATGTLIKSLTVGESLADIDIDASGRIAIGTGSSGNVVISDTALNTFTKFSATGTGGGSTFVAWVQPVPEPTSLLFGYGLFALISVRRFRRRPRDHDRML